MRLTCRFELRAAAACLLALPVPVLAHHSQAEYDRSRTVEIQGEIVEVFWRNPHVLVKVAATENGRRTVWELEGSSVSSQLRRGLSGDMLQVGDSVRVAGYPSTSRQNHMMLNHLLLPSGVELLLRTTREPRFSGSQAVGTGSAAFDEAKVAEAQAQEAQGIFRVWTWGDAEPELWYFSGPERFPLTVSALAAVEEYDQYEDNPMMQCVPPGMPALIGNPYPVTFVQVDDDMIEMRLEEFDSVRTIHLNGGPEADVEPSPLGYSIGRWEDEDTLVVETTRIATPYFNRVGVPLSPDVELDERFTVNEAAGRLEYELVVTDPQIFTEPWVWRPYWEWVPGEEIRAYQCAVAR